MALLERVRERVETDLLDPELSALIAEAQAEIRARYGPDRDEAEPIAANFSGGTATLDLQRPLDADEDVEIVEYESRFADPDSVTLEAGDYPVLNGGRTIERVAGGTNSRSTWGPYVVVTYVPLDDQKQRDEVTIKLVHLAVEYRGGVRYDRVGDASTGYADYTADRDKLLSGLAPRKGLMMA